MQSFELSGHRGARGERPENTLEGFAHAFRGGVHSVELDVGMTADGVLVVTHDRRLSGAIARDAGGRWLEAEGPTVASLSYEAIARYDVGRLNPRSDYAERFPEQRPVDGARIPTLAQVFDLALESASPVRFIVEVKTSPEAPHETRPPSLIAEAVAELIAAHELTERCLVESFDWRVMTHLRSLPWPVQTAHLTSQQPWFDNIEADKAGVSPWTKPWDVDDYEGSVPDLVHAAGGRVWAPFFRDLDGESLARARDLGLRVIVWTVNEISAMHALIDLGVDGIITDYPARLREVMLNRGLPVPPGS